MGLQTGACVGIAIDKRRGIVRAFKASAGKRGVGMGVACQCVSSRNKARRAPDGCVCRGGGGVGGVKIDVGSRRTLACKETQRGH